MKLDVQDMEIIRILQDDARAPVSEIAQKVSLSRATVQSRIENLKKLGVIKKFSAIINRDAITENALVIINIKTKNLKKVSKVLYKKKNILELHTSVGGGKNIICKAFVANLNELKRLLDGFEKIEDINDVDFFIISKTLKEEYEAKIGPEIGIRLECDDCGKIVSDDAVKYVLHNKEYYFCCTNCLKKFKDQRMILRNIK